MKIVSPDEYDNFMVVLDIDKWLVLFSFTVKLVSEIMSAFCAHTIDGLANGGKLPLALFP
jgi:hypothetical protein